MSTRKTKKSTKHDGVILRTEDQQALFEASGKVTLPGKLVAFLYLLMRDHLPPGVVGDLLKDFRLARQSSSFTNGWLARYAEYVAQALTDGSEVQRLGLRVAELEAMKADTQMSAGAARAIDELGRRAIPPDEAERAVELIRWVRGEARRQADARAQEREVCAQEFFKMAETGNLSLDDMVAKVRAGAGHKHRSST